MWFFYSISTSIAAALNSIFQKQTLKHIHGVQLLTVTSTVIVFPSIFLILFRKQIISLEAAILIAFYGLAVSFAAIFTIRALRHLDISIVAPFFYLGTAFVAILAYIIFKEEVSIIGWIGIYILIIGGYLLELKGKDLLQPIKELIRSRSMHYLLGGVFLYSLSFLIAKSALEHVDPIELFSYQQIISFFIFGLISFYIYDGLQDVKMGFKKGKGLIFIMAFLIIIENIFLFEALKIGDVILVIPIYRSWALWAVIFGGYIFKENHVGKRIFASLLMIIGIILISFG